MDSGNDHTAITAAEAAVEGLRALTQFKLDTKVITQGSHVN